MVKKGAIEKIAKVLGKEEMSTSEIAAETNRSYLDTIKILRELFKKRIVLRRIEGNAVYWRLKYDI